ncbi:intermembrane phospholipid transport protein YdbH family protein [Kangiella marina]|uniref:Dicarboxylate transport domain-containing protein n=1 Tax=Kangiella marina TaxID=1079178 RepID=A0ABP8IKA9_9GAMM
MQNTAAPKKSLLKTIAKYLLGFLPLLIIALGIAYWTAPSWVPGQVQKFLPPSIKLQNLEFKRPGLSSTDIDQLVLTLGDRGEGTEYRVALEQVNLGYSLWQRKLTSISAQSAEVQWPKSSSDSSTREALSAIPLPQLPVTDIHVKQLTLSGLTVQDLIAKEIRLRDSEQAMSINTQVHFLDKIFSVALTAKRRHQSVNQLELKLSQGSNQLTLNATPKTLKDWTFTTDGRIDLNQFFYSPGLEPMTFELAGGLKQDRVINLTLNPNSRISTGINANTLELTPQLQALLKGYNIKTNVDTFEPRYSVMMSSSEITSINYYPSGNKLEMPQGLLEVHATNPAVTTKLTVASLELDLDQPLTAKMQQFESAIEIDVKGLNAELNAPEHKSSSNNIRMSAQSDASLANSLLKLDNTTAHVSLGTVDYRGKNSTASIAQNTWDIKGLAHLSFSPDKITQHEWTLLSTKAFNSALNLDNEQFVATGIWPKLHFIQNTKNPTGKLTGNYQVADLSLKQQPLNLNSLKGNIEFVPSKDPHGHLSFANAKYNSQQIGVNSIAGELDWRKKTQSFAAQGLLKHQNSKVPFTYQFDLKNSRHNLKVKQSSLPVSTVTSWVNTLKNYPQLSFSSGQLEIDSLDGDPIGLLFDGKIKLDNFNLNYDEFYVKNWTIEDSLTSSSKLGGTLKSHIDSIELATDIAITDISFLMPHTINSLVVTNFKGNLLKGQLEIPQLSINEQGVSPFTAYLKSIDIGALLSRLKSEKLTLTGRFDFTLPLNISDRGQQITNGKFKALTEGVLQLKSEKGKDANIAFQALENFRYKEFSGTINYTLDGDYVIELNILGSNPNLYNGFPIKLDLTLRGKLPEMLYAMIISGDMTKPILDDLQQKQILNIQQ